MATVQYQMRSIGTSGIQLCPERDVAYVLLRYSGIAWRLQLVTLKASSTVAELLLPKHDISRQEMHEARQFPCASAKFQWLSAFEIGYKLDITSNYLHVYDPVSCWLPSTAAATAVGDLDKLQLVRQIGEAWSN